MARVSSNSTAPITDVTVRRRVPWERATAAYRILGDEGRRMSGEFAAAAAVTIVTTAMAWTVGRQWYARRRPYQAAWSLALAMAALAAGSYAVFLVAGRPPILFRLYYLFGAALNVAFLGLGSLYLVTKRSLRPLVIVLVVVSIVTASAVFAAPIDAIQLASTTGAGTHVLGDGPWLPLLIVMNTFGTVCLVGVALFSAGRTWLSHLAPERAIANVVIAVGALTIAGAGTVARLAGAGAFWVIMLIGWTVMFIGFMATSRRRVTATPTVQRSAVGDGTMRG